MAGGVTARYVAKAGRVYVREGGKLREISTALSTNGRDLARYEAALESARLQRRLKRAARSSER